jgi:hypothetical protein
MRDAFILVLLLVAAVLGYRVYSMNRTIAAQERQIRNLNEKANAKGLELQEKCAKQAGLAFKQNGYGKDEMDGYENHYNEKLNKCMVTISTGNPIDSEKFFSNYLIDAFENKTLGQLVYKGLQPFQCEITLPSGERKFCKSSDEFHELEKIYLQ